MQAEELVIGCLGAAKNVSEFTVAVIALAARDIKSIERHESRSAESFSYQLLVVLMPNCKTRTSAPRAGH
jgi:hypothetical protein